MFGGVCLPSLRWPGADMTRRPVSRVLFPAPFRDIGSATIPLRQASRPASRDTPGARAEDIPYAPPTWSCSRRGLPCQACYQARGGLLPHPFTLTSCRSGRRSALCGTFPRLAPGGCYPPPCLPGARTFLQWQVTPPPAIARPSGHGRAYSGYLAGVRVPQGVHPGSKIRGSALARISSARSASMYL